MMRTKKLRLLWVILGTPLIVLLLQNFHSYAYPDRPIRMIIPWPAGGDTDVIKRIVANTMEKHLGQPIVVANITGASGTVGAREARKALPDGYTIYSTHDYIHTTYYTGVSDVSYRDFEPICLITSTPSIFSVHGKAKWNTRNGRVRSR